MRKFFVESNCIRKDKIYIPKQEAHHIIDVLRFKKGDEIILFDGKGRDYFCIIEDIAEKDVIAAIKKTNKVAVENKISITLAQAIPKKNRMDYVVEKCTELGIDKIIPVITERTVVRISEERTKNKIQRWQKIIRETSKQCLRPYLPEVTKVMRLKEVIRSVKDYTLAIMPALIEDKQSLQEVISKHKRENKQIKNIIVFIGPEGGFSHKEVEMAKNAGCEIVSLGNNILKSDTAAIAMTAMLNYEKTL